MKGGGTIVVACVLALVACAPVETVVVSEAEESGALSDTEPESATIEPAPPVTDTVEESAVSFNVGLYSIEQADSLWVVVNKQRIYTPIDYAPVDLVVPEVPFNNPPLLREEAAQALESMLHAAREADADFVIQSSYRSFVVQQRIKQRSIERWGPEVSDGRSARAGHSEHQSGLAVDLTTKTGLCTLDPCFGQTSVGEWLAENSWRYGFILRYLPGKTDITGYIYEPWHFRYVGLELAEQVYQRGYPTLEEFFGLPPAPNYLD